jgi:glycine/D-amino acid oxidase-like deaminating enzyme
MSSHFEIAIIGSGIVGPATSLELTSRFPEVRLGRTRKGITPRWPSDKPQQRRGSIWDLLQPGSYSMYPLQRRGVALANKLARMV